MAKEANIGTSFEEFYRCQYRSVLALALALSHDQQAAEDLTQEAFAAAHQKWARLVSFDRPDAWVRRLVANRSVSRFRRLVNERRMLARLAGRSAAHRAADAPDASIWVLVRALPLRQAQVVALIYLEDRPIVDVARILGIQESTAKTHLRRARAALAEQIGADESEEVDDR